MNYHSHDHSHDHDHNPSPEEPQCSQQYSQKKHYNQVKSTFANYSRDMRASYDQIFGEKKVNRYYELVRERKREKMDIAIQANQKLLDAVLRSTEENGQQGFVPEEVTLCHNLQKLRSTIKQFHREWCSQSPELKDYIYLVDIAKKYVPKGANVLVPGSGLGRLPLELVEAGYHTQGNQVTYFMLFGSNFVLNCVEEKQSYEIYPFIHTLSGHENQDDMFRSVKIPDKLALQVVPQNCDFSMASGQFTEIYKQTPNNFQSVITCFFIDTANNIFQYIDTIFSILKSQGIWINYGPLLYHFKDMLDQVSIQLSLQQVMAYIRSKGFQLLREEQRQTTYCHDPRSSYTHVYNASLTVWKKP